LEKYQIAVKKVEPYAGGRRFILERCPFDSGHQGTSAAVFEDADGKPGFNCFHPECKDKSWTDLRRLFEPDFGKKKADGNRHDTGKNGEQSSKIVITELPDVRVVAQEEPTFLVPGLLVSGDLTVISGQASAGKTTFCMYLGLMIATGRAAFGGQCEKHPILYMTRENSVTFMADITRRFHIDNGAGTNFYIWGDWCEESAPVPTAANIVTWVSTCKPAPFVIVDSLIAFFDGKDENSSVEMRAFLNQGRTLLRAGACGVLFIAHPGKVDKMLRGSSDLIPAIDAGFFVSNSGDGKLEKLYLKAFKTRFLAQKSEVVLNYQADGFTVDERPTAVYEGVTERLKKLLAQLPGTTKTQFENAAQEKGLTRRDARHFLDKGFLNKWILREKGPRNSWFYRLAENESSARQV
jgi:predicted ATP-dependent serine protease